MYPPILYCEMGRLPQAQGRIEGPPFGYREGKDDKYGVLFAFDLVEGKFNPNSMENETAWNCLILLFCLILKV